MMIMAICIVNGTNSQNPSPKSVTRSDAVLPTERPATKTTAITSMAKTRASGNHRSAQSDRAIPIRVSAPPSFCSGREFIFLAPAYIDLAGLEVIAGEGAYLNAVLGGDETVAYEHLQVKPPSTTKE